MTKYIAFIFILSLIIGCSPNKQLARIDKKHGAMPILAYLSNNHKELFSAQLVNIRDSIRYVDSIVLKDVIVNYTGGSIDYLNKNGQTEIKNDSVCIKVSVKNGKVNVSGNIKQKPIIVDKFIPFNKAVKCPDCPNLNEVIRLSSEYNKHNLISKTNAFFYGLILGFIFCIIGIIVLALMTKKL